MSAHFQAHIFTGHYQCEPFSCCFFYVDTRIDQRLGALPLGYRWSFSLLYTLDFSLFGRSSSLISIPILWHTPTRPTHPQLSPNSHPEDR